MGNMSTAADFDRFYATPDPWGIAKYERRDRAMRAIMTPVVRGKSLLELGCGEGHLTRAVFGDAGWIVGVDISANAIARTPRLANADFQVRDQRDQDLKGFDVIAAIESLNYLAPAERERFFARLASEHRGTFIMMSAMGSGDYFTHAELLDIFERHGMKLAHWKNVYIGRQPGANVLCAVAARIPFVCDIAAEMLPEHFVCHRAYIVDCHL